MSRLALLLTLRWHLPNIQHVDALEQPLFYRRRRDVSAIITGLLVRHLLKQISLLYDSPFKSPPDNVELDSMSV